MGSNRRHTNRGGPIWRDEPFEVVRDGETIADYRAKRGDVFEPNEYELSAYGYKLGPAEEAVAPRPVAPPAAVDSDDVAQYHAGSGWYDIPGVGRVRGKDAALEAMRGVADGEDG